MPIFCVCVCVCVRRARGRNFVAIFTKIAQNLYFMNISKVLFLFFEIIFFSISKKLKTSKMALKLGLFSNNSWIVMKNYFYYEFSILNMFLSSKMTFHHFWGYPFFPKLTFCNNWPIIIKNYFYYYFWILNMFLSLKKTFTHFWGTHFCQNWHFFQC